MCGTQCVDTWKLCCQMLPLPLVSEVHEATSLIVFFNLQGNSGVPGLLLSLRVSSYFHPELHLFNTLENSTLRLDWILLLQVSLYLSNHFDRVPWVSPGFLTQSDFAESKNLLRQVRPDSTSALTLPQSFPLLSVLASFSPSFPCSCSRLKSWKAAERAEMADVKQMKKIVPLITCEVPFCQHACELVFGVDVLDLNLRFQINTVEQPVKSNSLVLDTCHCWTSAFDDHFNHCFVVLKNVEHRTEWRRLHVWRNIINITQSKIVVMNWNLGLVLGVLVWCGVTRRVSSYLIFGIFDWFGDEWNTSITMSQISRADSPSMRNPSSKERVSDSVELCETEACFLHIQLMGTNVRLPNIRKIPPEVDFESSRSPAKSESWSKPSRQCWAVLITWQYCR